MTHKNEISGILSINIIENDVVNFHNQITSTNSMLISVPFLVNIQPNLASLF